MGHRETSYSPEEVSNAIGPILYVQTENLQSLPTPLVRVTTCGGLKLEILQEVISTDRPQGRYHTVTLQQRPKGSSTGLTLLKVLTSLPDHYASKDWLTEHLPRNRSDDDDEGWGRGLVRVDNVVYLLRGLLCPSGIVEEEAARKMLVTYVRNHRESGPGYRLASDPLIWFDVDVIAASAKQAVLLEQQGKEALACWEQVYTLASRGSYLPDEAYSDWAKDKRIEVKGYLRQAVHALRRLYLARKGEAGEEQVLFLLRTYWHIHPLDEDVLRPLMELPSKHNGVQEALECYQRLCERLALEGGIPDHRTQKTAHNLRNGQSIYEHLVKAKPLFNAKSVYSSHSQDEYMSIAAPQQEVLSMLSTAIVQGIMIEVQALERISMDITKRDFLHMLGTSLVLAGVGGQLHPFVHTMLNGDQMGLLETEVATRWSVYHSGNTIQAHEGLPLWLAEIERFAKSTPSRSQNTRAYSLVSISYQLQGSIFRDKMDYGQAHNSYKKAFLAADEFNNMELKSSSLARRGVTFIQQQKPIEAIQYLESALFTIDELDFPYLKGYILQALSEAYAMIQHNDQSQMNIDLAEQVLARKNDVRESSNCQLNTTSITAQKGVNSVLVQDYAHALDLLNRGLNTYAPSLLRGRARLIAQKAEAYYGLGCIDESTFTALDAFDIARSIGSKKTMARIKNLYMSLTQSPYEKEGSVVQLGRMLATN